MEHKFLANRKRLNLLHNLKQLTVWSKFLFDTLGMFRIWSIVMNFFLKKGSVGIRYGNQMIYRQYSRVFKNAFKADVRASEKRGVSFFFAMGAESTYNSRSLMLAKYFETMGWNAEFLICDGIFDLCHKERIGKTRKNSSLFCFECRYGYRKVEDETGLPIKRLSHYSKGLDQILELAMRRVNSEIFSIQDCLNFCYDEYAVGEIVKVSVLRYHYSGYLQESYIEVYKKYIVEAIRCMLLIQGFLRERGTDLMILWNGAGFMDRMASEVCRRNGINYVTQESFWGDSSWIYKKNGIAIHLDFEEEYEKYGRFLPFGSEDHEKLMGLINGFRGSTYKLKSDDIMLELGLNHGDKFFVLFTNMNFDTYVLGRDKVFASMRDWVVKTIEFWRMRNPDTKLVIRAHPGELKFVTPSVDFIRDAVIPLKCDGLIFIDSDHNMDSYELVKNSEGVLVYSSTIGMESILMGKYVISSGASFYDKFVDKPKDLNDYYRLLDDLVSFNFSVKQNLDEMLRYLNFIYFHRIVNLRGMGINRETGENYIDADLNSEELIAFNKNELSSFFSEVVNENC